MNWSEYGILIIFAVVIIGIAVFHDWRQPADAPPTEPITITEIPDFSAYKDVKAKKRDFFNFLLPKIRQANARQLANRSMLQNLYPDSLTSQQEAQIDELAKRYRVNPNNLSSEELISQLLIRVDIVPASLILAQGANESAWGTSRFAKQGNNLFGIWCFTKGCGLTPLQRNSGASHEVERFDNVQAGVDKYVRTINSHPAYSKLRQLRQNQRQNQQPITGIKLAEGLEKYSERGHEYIDEIQSMISFNKLEQYNQTTELARAP